MKRITFAINFILLALLTQAQNPQNLCGISNTQADWLTKYQANPDRYEKSGDPLYVALAIHLVDDIEEIHFPHKSEIYDALCALNEDFEQANIHFYVTHDFNYITDSYYAEPDINRAYELVSNFNTPNKIDIFFVHNFDLPTSVSYPVDHLGIILQNYMLAPHNHHQWTHQMGHFFSLPHTCYGWDLWEQFPDGFDFTQPAPDSINWLPVELVDGTNCTVAGDGFCDTPPDYLANPWICNEDGESSIIQHDPAGVAFRSDGSFFMSYSNDDCQTRFSEEQIAAMRAYIENEDTMFLTTETPLPDISDTPLEQYYPIGGEEALLTDSNTIVLSWEEAENATKYIVQIAPFPSFQSLTWEYYSDTSSLVLSGLEPNEHYFWRVRAVSEWSSCTPYSDISDFRTPTFVSANELEVFRNVVIRPNPVAVGQNMQMQFKAQNKERSSMTILNTQGRVLSQKSINPVIGMQSMAIPTASLAPGIYFLQLQSSKGFHYEKFVVQ